jgi:hypothetical protein
MPPKPKRGERELKALIVQEVRKLPECRNIKDVVITRAPQIAAHHPNWDFGWVIDGPGVAPLSADEIAQRVRNEFDVADD